MLPLRIWMHLSYRLMLHGQEGQAEQAQVKEASLTVTILVAVRQAHNEVRTTVLSLRGNAGLALP